jgi:hypothetical protein
MANNLMFGNLLLRLPDSLPQGQPWWPDVPLTRPGVWRYFAAAITVSILLGLAVGQLLYRSFLT